MSRRFKPTTDQVTVFAMVDEIGEEGIPAFNGPGGVAMPMISSDEDRFEQLRAMAVQMAKHYGRPIKVLRFTQREEVEIINP